jgi:hypothetical protein
MSTVDIDLDRTASYGVAEDLWFVHDLAGFLRDWDRSLRSANHWPSEDMARHYGASAAGDRTRENQQRIGVGERA